MDRNRRIVFACFGLLLLVLGAVYLVNWRIGNLKHVTFGDSSDFTGVIELREDDGLKRPFKVEGLTSSEEQVAQALSASEKAERGGNESVSSYREPWSVTSHGVESVISIDSDSSEMIYTITNLTTESQFFQFALSVKGEPMPYSFLRLRNRATGDIISVSDQGSPSWQTVMTSNNQRPPLGNLPFGKSIELRFDPNPSLAFAVSAFCPQCDDLGSDNVDVQFSFDYELMHLSNPDLLSPLREQDIRLAKGENVAPEDFERALMASRTLANQADSGSNKSSKERQVFETEWVPMNELNWELPDEP